MDYFEMFQLNIFVALMIIILYFIIRFRLRVPTFRRMILTNITILTLLGIVMEPISWIFDGKLFFGAYFIEYSSNVILIMLTPVIAGFLLIYVDYYIYKNQKRLSQRLYYMGPALLTLILLIINSFVPIYFSVDPVSNRYSAADFYWIHLAIIIAFYLYLLYFVFMHWKRIDGEAKIIFIVFFAFPLIGMTIQSFNSRIFFSWTPIAFAIFLMYVFLESTSGDSDYLTKLFSRQSYEKFVDVLMENKQSFGILYLDLNDFKSINDTYGHLMGDKVLIEFSKILRECLTPNKMIARLGGDEFIAVLNEDVQIKHEVKCIQDMLKVSSIKQMNDLTFSYGFSVFDKRVSMDEIYFEVDNQMYNFKRKHHKHQDENSQRED